MLNNQSQKDAGIAVLLRVYKECVRASENTTVVGVMQTCKELSEVQNGIIFGFREKDGGIYQQDIAECHTTDSVRAWFKEHQDQFIVLPCPENSPDFSPINNLWNPLDWVVRVMDPHARNLVQQ
ncbi:uncharacterized protein TNCV_96931 [Trichonephila clavipes]|nr:uncharacterized protein TNCV_96931 [Trichonephila clavipes]